MEKVEIVRSLIRPFISVCIIVTLMYLFATGKIEPKELIAMAGPIFGFYFGERAVKRSTPAGQPDQEIAFINRQ